MNERARRRMVFILISVAWLSACARPPTPSVREAGSFVPDIPPPSNILPDLGNIFLLRAWSGPFESHEDRTELALPNIVVFDDGRVVADMGTPGNPNFQLIQLATAESRELRELVASFELMPLAAGDIRDAALCADCPTTIIRTDIEGETIEIAATGLLTDADPRYVAGLPYPRGVIGVDRLLNDLVDRVRNGATGRFEGDLPEIPIASLVHG